VLAGLAATATAAFAATKTWTGGGDGISWNDGANWSGGTAPGSGDQVLLENSVVGTSYQVDLPSGSTSTQVVRLSIAPTPGRTITVTLPSGNTADPGLRVGDGLAATDDIILNAGAVLINASGSATGNGIETNTTGNGTVRINNGARYVHASTRSPNGVAPVLSTVAGTENGEFEYDIPGTGVVNVAASGRTYGNLTLTRSAGAATYGSLGTSPLTVRGMLRINGGVTYAPAMTGAINLFGNVLDLGAGFTVLASQPVAFKAAGTQVVSGPGGMSLGGASSVQAGTMLEVAGPFTVNGTMTVDGTLQVDQAAVMGGTGTYGYGAGGTLAFSSTTAAIPVDGTSSYWPSSGGPTLVNVAGAGGISLAVGRTVSGVLQVSGPIAGANALTLSGSVEMGSGGSMDSSPVYAGEGTLIYKIPNQVSHEWGGGTSVGAGVPKHVIVRPGSGSVVIIADQRSVPGNLTIESGNLSFSDLGTLSIGGNLVSQSTASLTNGIVTFVGAGSQTIQGQGALQVEYLALDKSAGTLRLLGDVLCSGPQGGNALEFNGSTDVIDLGGYRLTVVGSVAGLNANGRFIGGGTSGLVLLGSAGTGTIRFEAGADTLHDLVADHSSGSVSLGGPLTVSGTLSLLSGKLITGVQTLVMAPGANVMRGSGHVVGRLRKTVPTGTATALTFEVGSNSDYTPIDVVFDHVTTTGTLTANANAGEHAQIATSGFEPAKTVNESWTLTNGGVGYDQYHATFRFTAGMIDAGANPSNFRVARFASGTWSVLTAGARTATTTEATGIAGFGDFAIGELKTFAVQSVVGGDDRYALEVAFASPLGSRVVVDSTINHLLANIQPSQLTSKVVSIYRDGRVVLDSVPQGAFQNGARGRGGVQTESMGPGFGTEQLHATFVSMGQLNPPYYTGTVPPSWGDFDDDGFVDLPLYHNNANGTFSEIPGFRTLLNNGSYHGISWCDYDKDGKLDLALLGYATIPTSSLLLHQTGNGVFQDVAPAQGMSLNGAFGETAVWADFDGDGDEDLFAPYYSHIYPYKSFLYRNNGNGTFTDIATQAGVDLPNLPESLKPEGADAADWNGDGYLDLFCASHLFINDGTGHFTDIATQAGLPQAFDEGAMFLDYDNDGDLDLYVRRTDAPHLYRNDAGHFTDVTAVSGISETELLWGDSWADVNNDGYLDLLYFVRPEQGLLMLNKGNGTFVEDSTFRSLHVIGASSSWADYDHDGDLDVVTGNGPLTIYANQLNTQSGFENSYLRVRVLDANGRPNEHGASIRLHRLNGDRSQVLTRIVGGGSDYIARSEYTTHFGVGNAGTVARSPDQPAYSLGTAVQLTATPEPGHHFVRWTGDVNTTTNPLSLIVDGNKNVKASFGLDSYTLTVSVAGNGSVTKSPDQATYEFGSKVTLTATAPVGYHLTGWSGSATGTQNPLILVMDGNKSVTAGFAIDTHTLQVNVVGGGTVAKSPDLPAYDYGTNVTLTPTPSPGYQFAGWSGDAGGSTQPLTVSMTTDKVITATFTLKTYTLSTAVIGGGAVIKNPNLATYTHGTSVTLTATPAAGYVFSGWSGDTTTTANPISFVMTANKSVTATFTIKTYTVNVTASGNGAVAKNPNQATYDHGTSVTLTATPQSGYHFVAWSGDTSATTNPLTLIVTANRNLTATFAINTYTLNVTTVGNGTVAKSPDQPSYAHGTVVTLTGTSPAGYHLDSWSGDANGYANPLTVTMDGNKNITATFTQNVTLKWSGAGDGATWANGANWVGGVAPRPFDGVLLDHSIVTGNYAVALPAGSTTVAITRLTMTPQAGKTITLTLPAGNTANPGLKVGDDTAGSDDIVLNAGAVLKNASGAAAGNGIEANAVGNGSVRIGNGARYVHATLRSASGVAPLLSTAAGTESGEFEYDAPGTGVVNIAASGRTYGNLTLTRSTGPASYGSLGASPLTIRGAFKINAGVTYSSAMTGTTYFAGDLTNLGVLLTLPSSQPVVFNGTTPQRVTGTGGVTVAGTSTVALGSTLALGATTFSNNGTLTIQGTLEIDDGGFPGGLGTYVYSSDGRLLFANGVGPFAIGNSQRFWTTTGGPLRVTVQGAGGVQFQEAKTAAGTIVVSAPIQGAGLLTIAGPAELNASGSFDVPPIYGSEGSLVYNTGRAVGAEWGAGSVVGVGVPRHVDIRATGGTVTLPASDRAVPGDLGVQDGTLRLAGGNLVLGGNLLVAGTLDCNGQSLVFTGGGVQSVSRSGGLSVPFVRLQKSAGSVILIDDLTLTGAADGSAIEFAGALDVFDLGSRTLTLLGSIKGGSGVSGFKAGSSSNLVVNGTGALGTARFVSGGRTIHDLTLQAAGPGTLALSTPLTVTGTLGLVAGTLSTGVDSLTLSATGTVVRTAGMVSGNLRKRIATGPSTMRYEVGTGSTYAPVDLTFGNVSTAGYVAVSTTGSEHPSVATSGINTARSINRWWSVANVGTGFDSCAATFNFAAADVDPGADPTGFGVRRYVVPNWSGPRTGARTATSIQALGLTGFGDFAAGDVTTYTLNVTTVGSGTVSKNPSDPSYGAGSSVVLTANPSTGWHFVGWSGDTVSANNPITMTMNGNKNVIATFAINTYTLNVTAVGNGAVTRNPSQATYTHGTSVTLTATSQAGYHLVSWSGDTTGTTNPLTFNMTANKNITATFAINTYTLDVSIVGGGTVTRTPNQATYDHGTGVTLTATPANGYHFVGWTGDTSTTASSIGFVMTVNKSVTATFAINTYTVTVNTVGSGTVTKNPNQAIYDHGTSLTLTATPLAGSHFASWSGDTTTSTNPLTLIVTGDRNLTATFALNVPKIWLGATGGGDGTSWSDARNWTGGTVPVSTDSVVLNNVNVTGNYTVNLPTGATGVTLFRLAIIPTPPRTITLSLPSGNTANPGLRVGDAGNATDDLILYSGAVLKNSSGAPTGNGVEVSSTTNGTVWLGNGARYIHNTARSTAGIVPRLSTAAGTESGVFEYDLPGTASAAIDLNGRNYGSLTLTRTAGAATYTTTGGSAGTVRKDFTINAGVTLTSTNVLNLGGDLTDNGAALALTTTVSFIGTSKQTISGTGAVTLGANSTVAANDTVAIGGTFNNNATMTVTGALQINQGATFGGTGTYSYNSSTGSLVFNTTSSLSVGNVAYWPTSSGPVQVGVIGAGGITMGANRSVTGQLTVGGPISRADRLTLSGTCRMNAGGSMPANSPTYGVSATLLYTATGSVGPEWGAGGAVGSGVPLNVIVQAAGGTITLPTTDRTVPGDLTITSGTLALNASAGNLTIGSDLLVTGALQPNGRTVIFSGSTLQTISGPANLNLDHLRLNKSANSVQLLTDLTCAATGGGNGLEFAGTTDVLDLNGRTLTLAGTVGGSDAAGSIKGSAASSLVLNGTGAMGTVRFTASFQTLDSLTVDRSSSGSAALGTPLTVGTLLTLTNGSVVTGANTLIMGTTATVARTNGFVEGSLRKRANVGATALTFEVGSGTTYAPVDVAFGNVTAAGNLTGASTGGDHPSISGSGLDPTKTANRYWTLTNSGIAFNNYSATFNFAAGDLDAGVNTGSFVVRKFNSPNWTAPTTGTLTATSTQATGLTSFSDFAVGSIQRYALNLTTAGNGAATKSPDQPSYDVGTAVTLTATPTPGFSFVGWSGDTTGSTNPLTVTMNANKNITANFTVSLNVSTVGSGTVTRSPNQATYAPGTAVTLTANPAAGWHFIGWSGDTASANNPITITMSANKNLTATFAINAYTLNVTTVGSGSVTKNPNQATYDHGTSVTLTASAGNGYHFVGWSGDTTGSTNPLTFTMTANKNLTATFAVNTYTVNVSTVGSGSVTKSPNQATYNHGTSLTLTANPGTGYHFVGWSGDTTATTNPLTFIVTSNKNLTATFAINTYTLNVTTVGPGSVTKNPDQPTYNHGTGVTLTASAGPGYHFVGWSGDTTATTNPLTFNMTANKNLTATFAINTYTVNLTTVGSGSVTRNPSQATYDHGTSVTLNATPGTGYHFVGWSGDTSTAANPISLVVTSNKNLTATFAINTYTLTVNVVGTGTIVRSPDQPTYNHGTSVTLTAGAPTGWHFVGWTGDTTTTNPTLVIVVNSNKNLTATFAINTYTLNLTTVGNGSVSKNPDQASYVHGTSVTVTASAQAGYHFTGWSGDTSTTTSPLTFVMTSNRNLTATFDPDLYTLSVTVVGAGAVAKNPDQAGYVAGAVVQLTATPAVGSHFMGWSGGATGNTNPTSITLNGNASVTATFAPDSHTVNVTTVGNGSVARSPNQPIYVHGSTVQLTATAGGGSHFVGWSGDTSGTDNPLSLLVDRNKNVTATFALDPHTVTVDVIGSGAVTKNPNQPTYLHGSTVHLTATPSPGFSFVGWAGDADGGDNPLDVLVYDDLHISAIFTASLTVNVSGSGAVAKSPNQTSYAPGTKVTLTATPDPGQRFVGWSGGAGGNDNPLSLVIADNTTVNATFVVADSLALTVNTTGNGTVTRNPNQTTFAPSAQVILTATPSTGFSFTGWSGDTTGSANPLTVTMNRDHSFTASFADTTPPAVHVNWPNGHEQIQVGGSANVRWAASDGVGVTAVNLYLSRTGPSGPWETLALNEPNDGSYSWSVTGPVSTDAWIRINAHDAAGNGNADLSDSAFTILSSPLAASDVLPTEFGISALIPNPTHGDARMVYTVPRTATVKLSVVDVQGREVAVLADGVHAAGRYPVTWSGRTATGRASPGTYFIRYRTPTANLVRRLVLTR
jgi:uncharacterized repeat protein (TIGR02543 family)